MLSRPPPNARYLWYFPTMNEQPLPAATPGASAVSRTAGIRRGPSLARLHSRAFYRPVPPVECDDDGYPCRDGKPVESTLHEKLVSYASYALRAHYAARGDVFVAADLGLFFEPGNRTALLVPDVLVAFGVDGEDRLSYKAWEEAGIPDFVLELLSPRTWQRDMAVKPPLYEAIGVREYWIFDPIGKLPDPIVGLCIGAAGTYRPVRELAGGGYRSEVLGLDLIVYGDGFRFRDPATGEMLPDYTEAMARVEELENRTAQ